MSQNIDLHRADVGFLFKVVNMAITNENWEKWLNRLYESDDFKLVNRMLDREQKKSLIFPNKTAYLKPLTNVDIEEIEVVLTGNRPMGIPSFADGLAYSSLGEVTPEMQYLHRLYKENTLKEPPLSKEVWREMGVMLLNRELTASSVSGYYSDTNVHKYWLPVTEKMIQRLVNDTKKRVFILADKNDYSWLKNPHGHEIFYSLDEGVKPLVDYLERQRRV